MNTIKKCRFCKEEILKDATICKHCNKKQTAGIGTRIGQFFIFIITMGIVISLISDKKETPTTPPATLAEQKVNISQVLKQSLEVLNKPYTSNRTSIDSVINEAKSFDNTAKVIKMGESSSNPEDQKLAKQLKGKLISLQIAQFPAIRKSYGELSGKALSGNSLTLVGGIFASNKNIGTTNATISPIAELLRFKRINYKFISSETEYQYYDLNSLKDGEISSQN
jgi:hypothetical protein